MLSTYSLAVLFLLAGLNHFRDPGFYRPLIPPDLPRPNLLIVTSGLLEILGALLLPPTVTRPFAAGGIVLMLVAFLPVHVFMLRERNGAFAGWSKPFLWLRIPAQLLLMWWAYAVMK